MGDPLSKNLHGLSFSTWNIDRERVELLYSKFAASCFQAKMAAGFPLDLRPFSLPSEKSDEDRDLQLNTHRGRGDFKSQSDLSSTLVYTQLHCA